ncbi:MAG: dephospho-CoA kinase [Chitinophagaceae bacterium]|nr:dephospho-CoA kinase [Oligoflexus sp.]
MLFSTLSQTWGIALTGGVASGKSTVGESLRQRGFVVIDADQASRLVVLPGTEGFKEVVATFGTNILTASGEMDRAKMREIVFQSPDKRATLESIIHHRLTHISEELLRRENLFDSPRFWFYEASLIYERKRAGDFNRVWVAYCPRALQIQRLMARDHCDQEQAERILIAQMPAEDKAKQADLVIDTDCDRPELERRIEQALASLTQDPSPKE